MKLSLGKKIAIGQIIVFLCFLFFAFLVLIYLNGIKNVNIKKLKKNYSHYANSKEIKLHIVQIQQFLSDISATKGEDGLNDGFKEAESNYKQLLKNLNDEKILSQEDKNLKMTEGLDEIIKRSEAYYKTGVEMANLYIKQGTKSGNTFMPNFDKASLALQEKVDLFSTEVSENFSNEIKKIGVDIDFIFNFAIWFPSLAIIGFGIFSYNFIKKLTTDLIEMTNELNRTTPNLIESSHSMSSLSIELSSCATEQAAAVQETASSLEEVAAMIGRNSENADSAKKSSAESLDSVKGGQQALVEMLKAMDEISKNNESFNFFVVKNNAELNEMVQVITGIADKTKVINDIVFQTKLLSFNASVEAARAGEQGKGFAVVAEEIGNLAQMSGNAANEIKVLLDESIVKVNKIVSATKSQVDVLINEGKEKIELGMTKARQCDDVLNEINNTSSSAEALVSEVALASKEQAQGIVEVNKAMGQIDEVTNQNAIASQSVSTSATLVMELSESIKGTADRLLLLVNG